jgi:TonB family protein
MIKKKVEGHWKYPDGLPGKHTVNVLFVLDRGGKLIRFEVLDSTDPRLERSAAQAMREASPFPPIPENLREHLAGTPLRMKFSIDFGVKSSQSQGT